ncbi:TPA: lysophospholipid acyltransferase family protein [Photobacterium damselae]
MTELQPFSLPKKTPLGLFERSMEHLTGLSQLQALYEQRPQALSSAEFLRYTLRSLNVRSRYLRKDFAQLPKTGPVVIVANHPLGGLEGVILASLILAHRPDLKLFANELLYSIPELRDIFIPVDVFSTTKAKVTNSNALNEGREHLKNGGVLLVFPAGAVSTQQADNVIDDLPWRHSAAKLAIETGAIVCPVYIQGQNSRAFYRAKKIHSLLGTCMLGRELLNKSGTCLGVAVGDLVKPATLYHYKTIPQVTAYLRMLTYSLEQSIKPRPETLANTYSNTISLPIDSRKLLVDIEHLPEEAKLISQGGMSAYIANVQQIPNLILEIGRLRESVFRAVGEGTGQSIDTDQFDKTYLHLFVWDHKDNKLVGAYRLGLVDKILHQGNLAALYTYSLFRYDNTLLKQFGPSIELGRSIIAKKYQRSPTALALLWRGICTFISRNPKYTHLFGPVTISNRYSKVSQQMMGEVLSREFGDTALSRCVQPRSPFQSQHYTWFNDSIHNLKQLDHFISQQENEASGIPVLLRQYLNIGGKVIAFNVDHDFQDALDGLLVVDLRDVSQRQLAKYMGTHAATSYLSYHKAYNDTYNR